MSTQEILSALKRKTGDAFNSLPTLFPELMKNNRTRRNEEDNADVKDESHDSSENLNSGRKAKKNGILLLASEDRDKVGHKSSNKLDLLAKLGKSGSRKNLETLDPKNKKIIMQLDQNKDSLQYEKGILEQHLSKTIIKLMHEPQNLLLHKNINLSNYHTETEEGLKDISLNDEEDSLSEFYHAEFYFFPLAALSKIRVAESGRKDKDMKSETFYCLLLKLQLKNTNLENNIELNLCKKNSIYMNFEKLFTMMKFESKADQTIQLLACIKKAKGGIAQFYDLSGDTLKDAYFKFSGKHFMPNSSDSSLVKTKMNKYLENDEEDSESKADDTLKSSSSTEKKDKSKYGLDSASILNSNHERMTADEIKHQIENLHEFALKVILKIFIGDTVSEQVTYQSSTIKEAAKNRYSQTNSDDVTFVSKAGISGRNVGLSGNSKSGKKESKKEVPRILKYLSLVSFMVFISIIGLAITEYYCKSLAATYMATNFSLLFESMKAVELFQNAGMLLRNLVEYNNSGFTQNNYYDLNVLNHLYQISVIQVQLSEINQNYTMLEIPTNNTINSFFTDKQTTITLIEGVSNDLQVQNYTYLHAFKVQTSFLLYLEPNSLSSYSQDNRYIKQYLYNNYNEFYFKSLELTNTFSAEIDGLISDYIILILIWLVIATIIYILLSLVITLLISKIEQEKTKILESFYRIPLYYVKYLSDLCGMFITKLQRNQEANCSEDDETDLLGLEIEEIETSYSTDTKKRQFKQNIFRETPMKFKPGVTFFKLIIFLLFFVVFFIVSYSNIISLSQSNFIALKYGQAYSNYALSYNVLREYNSNSNNRLLKESGPGLIKVMTDKWVQTSLTSNEIFSYASVYSNDIRADLLSSIIGIVYESVCLNPDIKALNACVDSPPTKVQAEYGLRMIINNFINLLESEFNHLGVKTNKSQIQMLKDPTYLKSLDLLSRYMNTSLPTISSYLSQNIDSLIQLENDYTTIQIISFSILLICTYLFLWLPFEYKINEDITRTQLMLNVFPDELLNSNLNLLN